MSVDFGSDTPKKAKKNSAKRKPTGEIGWKPGPVYKPAKGMKKIKQDKERATVEAKQNKQREKITTALKPLKKNSKVTVETIAGKTIAGKLTKKDGNWITVSYDNGTGKSSYSGDIAFIKSIKKG